MSLTHATKLLLRHQKEQKGMDRTTSNLVLIMMVKVVAIKKAETFECY